MSDGHLFDVPEILRTYNVSRSISKTTRLYSTLGVTRKAIPILSNPDISPAACIGFAILILTTVFGNLLVLAAIFLDRRLHLPSFFLIANMAIADLLLGICVLPFSSILELLNDHWIFGDTFCTTWLAIDVLCCTASIIGLMAVSIDRYIGVTRPLTYGGIMTMRRTIYLIIIVWAVSILTSVVPLFGLTDHVTKAEPLRTCEINKNTFYTIFSSLISFYIPVIILLILYSRVYQEAKQQGEKLEKEKRRLYEIDYQIVSQNILQQQRSQSNGNLKQHADPSSHKNGVSSPTLSHKTIPVPDEEPCLHRTSISTDLKNKNNNNNDDDDTSHSSSSGTPKKNVVRRLFGERVYSTVKRNSFFHTLPHPTQSNQHHHSMLPNDELALIRRKLHKLKHEKKAFRTVGLILGALLICWFPFFVTLPVMSILKHEEVIEDENTENTWFKIAFWLGYCNSALNPFVYAFSNRAIRRAFREVIFRRCCCCCCICGSKSINEHQLAQRQRMRSNSFTETSQMMSKRAHSYSADVCRIIPKTHKELDASANVPSQKPSTCAPVVVSFEDFLEDTGNDDDDDEQKTGEVPLTSIKDNPSST